MQNSTGSLQSLPSWVWPVGVVILAGVITVFRLTVPQGDAVGSVATQAFASTAVRPGSSAVVEERVATRAIKQPQTSSASAPLPEPASIDDVVTGQQPGERPGERDEMLRATGAVTRLGSGSSSDSMAHTLRASPVAGQGAVGSVTSRSSEAGSRDSVVQARTRFVRGESVPSAEVSAALEPALPDSVFSSIDSTTPVSYGERSSSIGTGQAAQEQGSTDIVEEAGSDDTAFGGGEDVDPVAYEQEWPYSDCPRELPYGEGEAYAQSLKDLYGCHYLSECTVTRPRSDSECTWYFVSR